MQQRKSFFIEDYVFLDCLSGFLQNLSALRLCRDATTLRCRPISRLLVIDPRTLHSTVNYTIAIGSSSYTGLIYASSAYASFPDLLLVSCSPDSVPLLYVITKLASNALLLSTFPSFSASVFLSPCSLGYTFFQMMIVATGDDRISIESQMQALGLHQQVDHREASTFYIGEDASVQHQE
ncbi:hypothetical protein Tco_1403614 [Tanacetum coccineum]